MCTEFFQKNYPNNPRKKTDDFKCSVVNVITVGKNGLFLSNTNSLFKILKSIFKIPINFCKIKLQIPFSFLKLIYYDFNIYLITHQRGCKVSTTLWSAKSAKPEPLDPKMKQVRI
jgi:hypothetical protein